MCCCLTSQLLLLENFLNCSATFVPAVLSIDDDPQTLTLREAVLYAEGFKVFSASSGKAGIALANQYEISVTVLDYSMPDMDGEEVARVLKREHPDLPIIICSGFDGIPDAVFKFVEGFVSKGDSPEFLIAAIRRVIDRRKPPGHERRRRRRLDRSA